ncbi:hypothetical protein EO763_05085 [Pectobacterium odoriferum]|uniref:hypothetical protein n=1 Tax=Pectobacterium odoriferum TaxID=78398 RepID=UPI001373C281|nr:hypothetical protein [Pectobacterium odoriferum]QHP79364.1 hypothetical protein EO763_05085 [Pectobacterium odoriferum]
MDSINNSAFYLSLALLILFVAFVAFLSFMLNDLDLSLKRRKYEETIRKAINAEKIKNEDIYLLAERWSVKREKISVALNFILNDYLNEKDCTDERLGKIRNLIVWHQENDPFSDLPDNIRLQLQHLQSTAIGCQDDVIKLSKSLSDISISAKRQAKRERLMTYLSVILGVAGLVIGVIGLMYGTSR